MHGGWRSRGDVFLAERSDTGACGDTQGEKAHASLRRRMDHRHTAVCADVSVAVSGAAVDFGLALQLWHMEKPNCRI